MINIELTGSLPTVNANLEPAMGQIGEIMFDSVTQNFIAGGRPDQWAPLKKTGEASHLIKSGKMFQAVTMMSDATSATVFIDTDQIPYAAIHNFGGTIVVAPRSNVKTRHTTKKYKIEIPARPFMLFQEQDKKKILEIVSSAIFTTS